MHDVYGEPPCDGATEFHEEHGESPAPEPVSA
jgi:hypothetical protein